ncbi:hypothetical protein QG37_08021 [Candidozyma auris]|nr:hypothetical protein QG37_08021 [[Candida] auris]
MFHFSAFEPEVGLRLMSLLQFQKSYGDKYWWIQQKWYQLFSIYYTEFPSQN